MHSLDLTALSFRVLHGLDVSFIFNKRDEYFISSAINICYDGELDIESQGGAMFGSGLHVLDMIVCGYVASLTCF